VSDEARLMVSGLNLDQLVESSRFSRLVFPGLHFVLAALVFGTRFFAPRRRAGDEWVLQFAKSAPAVKRHALILPVSCPKELGQSMGRIREDCFVLLGETFGGPGQGTVRSILAKPDICRPAEAAFLKNTTLGGETKKNKFRAFFKPNPH